MIRSSLCACCTPAVFRFSRIIWQRSPALRRRTRPSARRTPSISSSFSSTASDAVRRQALDGERPGDPHALLVLVGLVVEVLEVGLGRDGGVDLLLPRDARLPPVGVQPPSRCGRPFRVGLARDLPIPPTSASERRVQLLAQRLQRLPATSPRSRRSRRCWRCDFSVMCGTRS